MRVKKEFLGFGNKNVSELSLKDIVKKLPSLLKINTDDLKLKLDKNVSLKWSLDKDGKPVITSSLFIPLKSGYGSLIQLVTVLSLNIEKAIFTLKQRQLVKIDNKEKLKEDISLFLNEKFKDLKDLIGKVTDAILTSIRVILKKIGLVKEAYSLTLTTEEEDGKRTGVIVKVGNKWRIKGKKTKYWDAEYDTKADAQAALRAYWANKHESRTYNRPVRIEGFNTPVVENLLKNIQSSLIKVFGPSLYFDHYTDNSVDLFYKGDPIAELLYNDSTEELVIMPDDDSLPPVSFYDTSEYELKDYLSDLILGDLNPEFA